MHTDEGAELYQSNAILRYVGRKYPGKNGENLYPCHSDPELTWAIDNILDSNEDYVMPLANFTVPLVPAYQNKDEHFTKWILELFPKFLQNIEDHLEKNGGPYLLGSKITIADFSTMSPFVRTSHNDVYENSDILQAVIAKYPKAQSWINHMVELCKDYIDNNKYPF